MTVRHTPLLRLRDIGYEGFHQILEASALPESQLESLQPENVQKTLQGHTIALLTTISAATADTLSYTTSIRALGGDVCVVQAGTPTSPPMPMQAVLCRAHADAVLTCGLPQNALESFATHCEELHLPLCNGGNAQSHLCAALGDIALFAADTPLDTLRIAWVGGANGLAHTLIEAAIYAPFELFMALPVWGEPDKDLLGLALKAGAKIFLTRELHMALDNAHYAYAGLPYPDQNALSPYSMRLTPDILRHARTDVRVLAGEGMPDNALWDPLLHVRRLKYRQHVQKTLFSRWLATAAP